EWGQFNIGSEEHIEFNQPQITSLALNKINDLNGSVIAGKLTSNGRVILVNPNGIVFESGSVINVGGLVASGLLLEDPAMNDQDFPAELSFVYDQGSGVVVNEGDINASIGGV